MATTLNPNLLLAIPLAPLAGSLIAGLFGNAVGRKGAHRITILGVLIAFLLSDATRQITGQIVHIDGGLTLEQALGA